MHILLVEDDARLARSYQRHLERAGHRVEVRYDAESALERVSQSQSQSQTASRGTAESDFHVIVLDVLLPGQSGIALCRELRRQDVHTPILLLTAVDTVEEKVAGLDAGADDYLTKPFPFPELLARLRALVRRPHGFEPDAGATQLRVGDLLIDQLRHEVFRGGREVALTPQEFGLLEYLARHADRVLTRDQLMAHLWPNGTEAGSNVLDTYISHLRAKLEADVNDRLIHTVRGVGYALRTPAASATAEEGAR